MGERSDILKEVLNKAQTQSSLLKVYKEFKFNDVQMHNYYAVSENHVYSLTSGQSSFQMNIADHSANVGYFRNYLKNFIPSESLSAIYYFDTQFGGFSYGTNEYGSYGTPYGIDNYDYMYTFELYKRHFGDFITSPHSFNINTLLIENPTESGLFNNSDERWFKFTFNNYNQFGIGDLYTGIFYLFSTSALAISNYELTYISNQARKEILANCSIQPDEFTHSINPTALDDDEYLDKLNSNPEILKNGGLELGNLAEWDPFYCSIESSTANVYSGVYSLKATFDDSSTTDSLIEYNFDLKNSPILEKDKIRVEWFIDKGTVTANKNFMFKIQQYNGSSYITTQTKSLSASEIPYGEWYRVVLYDSVQYVDKIKLLIQVNDNPKDFSYFFIDNLSLKLQKGTVNKSNLFITSIGLFDENNQMLMVAKLAKPIRKSSYPLLIQVRGDLV